MTYTVDLGAKALQELGESFEWYEEKQPGLGERFLNSVISVFQKLRNIRKGIL